MFGISKYKKNATWRWREPTCHLYLISVYAMTARLVEWLNINTLQDMIIVQCDFLSSDSPSIILPTLGSIHYLCDTGDRQNLLAAKNVTRPPLAHASHPLWPWSESYLVPPFWQLSGTWELWCKTIGRRGLGVCPYRFFKLCSERPAFYIFWHLPLVFLYLLWKMG